MCWILFFFVATELALGTSSMDILAGHVVPLVPLWPQACFWNRGFIPNFPLGAQANHKAKHVYVQDRCKMMM